MSAGGIPRAILSEFSTWTRTEPAGYGATAWPSAGDYSKASDTTAARASASRSPPSPREQITRADYTATAGWNAGETAGTARPEHHPASSWPSHPARATRAACVRAAPSSAGDRTGMARSRRRTASSWPSSPAITTRAASAPTAAWSAGPGTTRASLTLPTNSSPAWR